MRICGLACIAMIAAPLPAMAQDEPGPILIERQGSFSVGSSGIASEGSATLRCDHGYVEYQRPADARDLPIFFWHSSSTFVWQNRWDGEEGFQSLFLRRGYRVYLWDGPRVGRANWGCEDYGHEAVAGRDQQNFTSWRFGAEWMEWFDGVQFPTDDPEAFEQAMRARYNEFDRIENIRLEANAATQAFDRIGPAIVVTSSAGGLRALLAATENDSIRAIIAYENPGYLFPEREGPEGPDSPFGPMRVSEADFLKLTRIPMQFVWGDNLDASPIWAAKFEECRQFVELVNAHGGQAEILMLTEQGLEGNTHMPFADLNNREVAALLDDFLARHELDGR